MAIYKKYYVPTRQLGDRDSIALREDAKQIFQIRINVLAPYCCKSSISDTFSHAESPISDVYCEVEDEYICWNE